MSRASEMVVTLHVRDRLSPWFDYLSLRLFLLTFRLPHRKLLVANIPIERPQEMNDLGKVVNRMTKARKAITDKHGIRKPARFIVDKMPCPVCEEGTLHYSISQFNGHIHAKCSTDNCVAWME